MTAEQLLTAGAIYFEHVRQGLEEYESEIRKMNAAQAYQLFMDMWIERGRKGAFTDFYYYRLDWEARHKADEVLSYEETEYLKKIEQDEDIIIFPLDEPLLRIVVKLNEAAVLFSTIYFTGSRSTWWGNYNQEYIVFKDKR